MSSKTLLLSKVAICDFKESDCQTGDIDIKTNLVYEHLKRQYFGGGMSIYGHY